MTEQTADWPLQAVDKLYVINLESRVDRRRETVAELARLGLSDKNSAVEFFPAVRPDDAGSFPSVGARGCFLSHLGVLRRAHQAGYNAIMILEDDAVFTRGFVDHHTDLVALLAGAEWGIAYLGYRIASKEMPSDGEGDIAPWRVLPPQIGVQTTHAMLVHKSAIANLITYLEKMLKRPAGDPEGGPMHVDGAYSWFRASRPDLNTVVLPHPAVEQRSSRSDIYEARMKDRLPLISVFRRMRNLFWGRV